MKRVLLAPLSLSKNLAEANYLAALSDNAQWVERARTPITFAELPMNPQEGWQIPVLDSNTATWGATITGTGAFHVLAYYDGTNFTVMGK